MLDASTKLIAEAFLLRTAGIPILGEWVQLRLVYNQGAAFGLHVGPYSRWIFLGVAALAVVILYRMSRQGSIGDWFRQLALGLVAGGAAGNLIDRVRSARGVVDFLDVGIGSLRTLPSAWAPLPLPCHFGAKMPAGPSRNRPAPRSLPSQDPLSGFQFSVVVATTERLDRFLADQLPLSRSHAARLVAAGQVRVDGAVARASRHLAYRECVTVELPDATPLPTLGPAAIPITVVYEDDALAVIDKPAGLVVHPAPGHWDDTLLNALVARGTTLGGGAHGRPGIVHRLDRDTSGLMLVAKHELAHRRLAEALARRGVYRAYAALVWGHLAQDSILVDAPIARHPKDRKRMAVLAGGRPSQTTAHVVARFGTVDLLRVELATGRTHQIRVHLSHVGHPIVGDPVYGGGGSRRISGSGQTSARAIEQVTPRQALHAAVLGFRHPMTGAEMMLTSEWPADLRASLVRAAEGVDLVAEKEPLRYLRFLNRDG
jgi:23S rRNA pseudouridine1911/1915/1917 synthase